MLKHPFFMRIAEIAAECNYAQRRLLELQRPWLNSSATGMHAPNDSTTRNDAAAHVGHGGRSR
jgi:hypothetical protein